MSEPEEIFARCQKLLGSGSGALAGRRVVVSAGGTREPIDAVRYVGNRASGRMGVALAAEAARRGAEVTLLAANLAVPPPPGVEVVETPTADALLDAALARADADLIVMAAAVADYRPAEERADKRPKDDQPWTVELRPTADVLRTLAERRANGTVLVGFAADIGEPGLQRAREKLDAKGANLFVFNDVSKSDIGFDAPENEVVIVSQRGEERIDKAPKERIAAAVLDRAERLLREDA
jgi:phosphopantothenoylcysteine decarboxylase/phosphopantothenate--cysteine ligase